MVTEARPKAGKTKPKAKLKTMNEVSAAEAVKLFHACMVLDDGDPMSLYAPIPENFPEDIAAKDFLEQLRIYRDMWSEGEHSASGGFDFLSDAQREELVEVAKTLPEKDLETLGRQKRRIVELFRENPDIQNKEIAARLAPMSTKTVEKHVSALLKKFKVKNRMELADRLPQLPPKSNPS
jgi:DNA-binding CsgD family transcriptional regulator